MLFRLTLRKFWEHPNPPTVREASDLITACLEAVRNRGDAAKLQGAVDHVRRWYPDFNPDDLQPRFGHRRHEDAARPERERERESAPTPAPNPPGSAPEPAAPDNPDDSPENADRDGEGPLPQDPPTPEREPDAPPEPEPAPEP
ncbi:MAG: hypothetical protein FJ290_10185, partial [Planctomycetes bacterium]|nr:hypothetical protein [Planctomycetota bacterium]